jgi:hypothetical protein
MVLTDWAVKTSGFTPRWTGSPSGDRASFAADPPTFMHAPVLSPEPLLEKSEIDCICHCLVAIIVGMKMVY